MLHHGSELEGGAFDLAVDLGQKNTGLDAGFRWDHYIFGLDAGGWVKARVNTWEGPVPLYTPVFVNLEVGWEIMGYFTLAWIHH